MRVELMCVTFRRDLPWMEYLMKSINQYALGFGCTKIVVPYDDLDLFLHLEQVKASDGAPTFIRRYKEAPWAPMLHHEAQIVSADLWCPDADMVMLIDADCIFARKFSPSSYCVDGLPILLRQSFESLERLHPGHPVANWKPVTEQALGIPVTQETMRRHPAMHWRETYQECRKMIERTHGMPATEYILTCRDSYPQGFCEHVALGNAALAKLPEKYHDIDVEQGWPEIYVDDAICHQGWSRWGNSDEHKRKAALQTKAWDRFLAGDREGGRKALAAMQDRSHG